MESDIKLNDGAVVIEGNTCEIYAHDLILDRKSRRSKQADPRRPRRALVHDFNDGLTLNWDNDYPGGVTIQGRLLVRTTDIVIGEGAHGAPVTTEEIVDLDLVQLVKDLREQVYLLKAEVAALKK